MGFGWKLGELTAVSAGNIMKLDMKNKSITIDDLAMMVKKGFDETAKREAVDLRFDKIDERLEKIEKLILADHKRRIEKLEIEVKELKELLAVK